ncbi:Beta-N-acetylglucosaminidase [Anaerostipes hadrus]|uniref:Beta-N-acetylglucosaminidase n=1 Tax=Anaerostipes hadrus TaxID=649756 RepID=A0A174JTI6_ANAHA|nr:glucosaminidase domain-containing protein [Anaerostipes hadrus]CUP00475.1 Beta-N-acetylglucosaminidase [Anaerostipes hadrus]
MAIAVHESAWGTSRRAQEDHNLTGYGVYSDSAKGINAPSKEENLLMTAKLLKESYLTKSGSHYKGTSLMAVNESYCTSGDWAINVTTHAYTLMDRL